MLTTTTASISKISNEEASAMLNLMRLYYENVSEKGFHTDLAAKDTVIRLWKGKELCGFTTQVLRSYVVQGQPVRILFSGDTIVAEEHRRSFAIPVAWGRMMLSILAEDPRKPLFWLLTTKGYKTYRYLPVFFKDYYPRPDSEPDELGRMILTKIVPDWFGERFDIQRGILQAGPNDQRLRSGTADVTDSRRQVKEIAYFEQINPGHVKGDELVCLARFDETNLSPFILKRLLSL